MSEKEIEILNLLATTVSNLWSTGLTNFKAPAYNAMRSPDVGDWVMENTTGHLKNQNIKRIGRLEKIVLEERFYSDEAKKEFLDHGEEIPKEKCYYIRLIDGTEFKWTNCSFIKIPTERLP